MRASPLHPSLDEWLAQKQRVSVSLSEGGRISAIIVEFDGRVLLTELDWLHRVAPHLFIRVLPIEEGWSFNPEKPTCSDSYKDFGDDEMSEEVCTHGSTPLECRECTRALVMADPVARAAYWQNRCERREREIEELKILLIRCEPACRAVDQWSLVDIITAATRR